MSCIPLALNGVSGGSHIGTVRHIAYLIDRNAGTACNHLPMDTAGYILADQHMDRYWNSTEKQPA